MCKDLGICLEEGDKNGAALPITRIISDYYAEIQKMGGGRWDTSSLMRRLTRA
jgi:3-hydroxyisobutyrate dehydrogenase